MLYEIQVPGFTISEFELLAGIKKNVAYQMIKDKKLRAVLDVTNKYRIPYSQGCAFMERQDEQR